MARLCANGGDNESSRRLHRGSRKSQACRDVVPKGRFTLGLAGRVDMTEKKAQTAKGWAFYGNGRWTEK